MLNLLFSDVVGMRGKATSDVVKFHVGGQDGDGRKGENNANSMNIGAHLYIVTL